jgi:NADH:ubiquinone reductase (non-electrogenic)
LNSKAQPKILSHSNSLQQQRHLLFTLSSTSSSRWSMAATTRGLMKASALSIGFSTATRRSFATSSQSFLSRARPNCRVALNKSQIQQTFRRTYADVAPAKKPRRFRWFKSFWRLTYVSAIVGTAYLAYGVYELRHPEDQFEPDPNKKNLVILGNCSNWFIYESS